MLCLFLFYFLMTLTVDGVELHTVIVTLAFFLLFKIDLLFWISCYLPKHLLKLQCARALSWHVFLLETIGGWLENCDELSASGTDCASTLGSGKACLVVERRLGNGFDPH